MKNKLSVIDVGNVHILYYQIQLNISIILPLFLYEVYEIF